MMAGLAGALTVYSYSQFSDVTFSTLSVGLPLLAFAFLGGLTSVSGALLAATLCPGGISFVLVTDLFSHAGLYYILVTGLSLITTAMSYPQGMAGTFGEKFGHKFRSRQPAQQDDTANAALEPERVLVVDEVIIDNVTLRYGGVTAVDGASLRVARGEIVGLIGPNGAGKTSLIDAVSGYARY